MEANICKPHIQYIVIIQYIQETFTTQKKKNHNKTIQQSIKGKHFSTVKKSPKKQKWKVKLWNGNKYLQTTYPVYGYYPIYTRNIYNSKKTQQNNPTTKYGQRNCINKTYKWPVDTWKRPDSLQPQGL